MPKNHIQTEEMPMDGVKLSCSSMPWKSAPLEQMLAEMAQAGYDGAEANVNMGLSPQQVRDIWKRHRLGWGPGYLGLSDAMDPRQRAKDMEQARRHVAFSKELGLTELFVAAASPPQRRALAGHVGTQNATPTEYIRQLADQLNEIGQMTLRDGIRICFHNHVGSVIETRDEIDRLLAMVDPTVVFLGADIGHLVWGGGEAVGFCKDYGQRFIALDVKDIDPKVLAEGVAQGWTYDEFAAKGIFAELGEGMIDFPAMFQVLREKRFRGWLRVEIDVTRKPTALQSALICREYLRKLGV
jgi:inosose dehydratase